MAKKQKIRLKMFGDYEVKDLPAFRKYFDWDLALQYFQSGELRTWLRERYYDFEADMLEQLNERAADFPQKFCDLFGVELDAAIEYVPPGASSQVAHNMSQRNSFGRMKNAPQPRQSRILAMPSHSDKKI